jgi:hypothetical protein
MRLGPLDPVSPDVSLLGAVQHQGSDDQSCAAGHRVDRGLGYLPGQYHLDKSARRYGRDPGQDPRG